MRPARTLLAMLMLFISAGCVRLPWDSAEGFFTRCMASSGIEVVDVEVEIQADGMSLGYSPTDMNAPGLDGATRRCTDELVRLYSSNSTTTRPE